MMSNRIFNVNGRGFEMLRAVLRLAFIQSGSDKTPMRAEGFAILPQNGIALLWYNSSNGDKFSHPFPTRLTSDMAAPLVFEWLQSKEAEKIPCEGLDANADHDGENILGWRVYLDRNIEDVSGVICVVRPSYNWIGK